MPEPFESLVIQYGAAAVFGTIGGVLLIFVVSVVAAWKIGMRRGWELAWSSEGQAAAAAEASGDDSAADLPSGAGDDTPIVAVAPVDDVTPIVAVAPVDDVTPIIAMAPVDNDATPIIPLAPIEDPGASTGPRRMVSVPADGTGGHRASEQTLKRVTAEQIEAEAKLKPLRASEVASNPLLPEGEVKIRCIACSKKMKASGPKFAKQRRCPFCKIEPFRYLIAD